jgi:hypothetical protein
MMMAKADKDDEAGTPPSRRTVAGVRDLKGLLDAIRIAAEVADFEPLFDYFADDIELRVSIALQSPSSEKRRGRQSVIRHLRLRYGVGSPPSEAPVDVFGSANRVVACRSATFAIARGLRVRDDCALAFDMSDGLIDQLAIHHELSLLTIGPLFSRRPQSL